MLPQQAPALALPPKLQRPTMSRTWRVLPAAATDPFLCGILWVEGPTGCLFQSGIVHRSANDRVVGDSGLIHIDAPAGRHRLHPVGRRSVSEQAMGAAAEPRGGVQVAQIQAYPPNRVLTAIAIRDTF